MTMEEWVESRRDYLISYIRKLVPNLRTEDFDIDDLWEWAINDEYLYLLSIEEGVDHDE